MMFHKDIPMKAIYKSWRKRAKQTLPVLKPEDYWINRGDDVIGNLTKDDMLNKNRQIDTDRAIYDLVLKLSIRQVVDLGCNVSVLGVLLREEGFNGEYIGIDSNPNALSVAETNLSSYNGLYKFYEANLRHLEFPSQAFEMVILKDVLEHLEGFQQVLLETLRISRRYVIIANFIPWTEGDTIIKRHPAGYFLNLYSRREVYRCIKDAGFDVVSVTSALEADGRPNEVVLLQRKG